MHFDDRRRHATSRRNEIVSVATTLALGLDEIAASIVSGMTAKPYIFINNK